MSRRLGAASAAASLFLAGCGAWQTQAPVTATSYAESREVVPRHLGRLRRLVVLELGRAAPGACRAGTDGELSLGGPGSPAVALLAQDKGYEVIVPEQPETLLAADVLPALAEELGLAVRQRDEARAAPTLQALLGRLGREHRADGLLLIEVSFSCPRALLRGPLAVGTLGLSELMVGGELLQLETLYSATAWEVAGGHLVWQHAIGRAAQAWENFLHFGDTTRRSSPLEQLLAPIEPALPKLLTR